MEKLIVTRKSQTVLVDFQEIISINALGRYTTIVTEKKNYTICKNLGLLELETPDYFFRIHDSCIINIRRISNIDGKIVNMGNGETHKIANNRLKKFKDYIEILCNHKKSD
ncbi:MAG: LytTR family DNA-binding domain-containing protein [Mariniphaga sp.]|nr:LytTR family DNA-binding domain-containing protein [Mariniphaga sp.]MDD4227074.1 LytTR family DNA-binding domain-containing protein [Mariniphaga sp.]MDD4425373.1 LytTR family DNA-binding domain-containing protein [Mariniphaga sp.]